MSPTPPSLTLAGIKRPFVPDETPSASPLSAPRTVHNKRSRSDHLSPLGAKSSANNNNDGNGSVDTAVRQNPSPSYPSFRNVSACNRCRLRKNRCDQRLPQCQSCEKARVHCVGYDPTTKREIPRSYTFFLESRVAYLEKQLTDNDIEFRPGQAYEGETTPDNVKDDGKEKLANSNAHEADIQLKVEPDQIDGSDSKASLGTAIGRDDGQEQHSAEPDRKLDNLVSNIGMVSVQGASDPRYLGSTSGISFARVFFAALRSSVVAPGGSGSERGSTRQGEHRPSTTVAAATGGGGSMRDSFFGLQTRPTMKHAPFPEKELAEKLVNLYFEHANPQIPILHRDEFMELFERIYSDESSRSARDMYILNIVCAIGAGIIFDVKSDGDSHQGNSPFQSDSLPSPKRQKLSAHQCQPEEYHASAVVHLEAFLCSSSTTDGSGSGLEELQAVLLLASFAVLRPVAPGLWYIVGVAVRLAVDLGLHFEDGAGIDTTDDNEAPRRMANRDDSTDTSEPPRKSSIGSRERGRREWIRDLRRRLFWCVYSFDRLVSTCVGRPFGITDEVITTEFPSLLDDKYINKSGFLKPPPDDTVSYKHVAHHYFKLRLLQSEIQQVLQYQQAKMARCANQSETDTYLHKDLSSPFLQKFESFRSWREDIHRRLKEWLVSAPISEEIGVRFPVEFLELNYWQALITLYRQSLAVPAPLANELNPTEEISTPKLTSEDGCEDEDDIYLKVAEAGRKVLRLYRKLHCVRLVNYTYLATHHLFMAGISFLYAIWHSPLVRERLTFDDVDSTVYAAISVLTDLMEKCPPAEACRDAFDRMSKATIKMCLSTTGFGPLPGKNAGQRASPPNGDEKKLNNQDSADLQTSQLDSVAPAHDPENAAPAADTWEGVPGLSGIQAESRYGINDSSRAQLQPQEYATSQPQFPVPDNHLHSISQPPNYNFYPTSQHETIPQNYRFSNTIENTQQPYQLFEDLTDLDFLNFSRNIHPFQHPSYNNLSTSGPGEGNDAEADLLSPMAQFDPSRAGLDLRFDMGLDFQHSWSGGGGIDLDGYFFGASGGYNGYGV